MVQVPWVRVIPAGRAGDISHTAFVTGPLLGPLTVTPIGSCAHNPSPDANPWSFAAKKSCVPTATIWLGAEPTDWWPGMSSTIHDDSLVISNAPNSEPLEASFIWKKSRVPTCANGMCRSFHSMAKSSAFQVDSLVVSCIHKSVVATFVLLLVKTICEPIAVTLSTWLLAQDGIGRTSVTCHVDSLVVSMAHNSQSELLLLDHPLKKIFVPIDTKLRGKIGPPRR